MNGNIFQHSNNASTQSLFSTLLLLESEKQTNEKLEEIKKKLDNYIESKKSEDKTAITRKPKQNEFNKTTLNRVEIALLMLALRDNGAFLKNTSNKLLAKSFADLTDYDAVKLEQLISGEAQRKKTNISDNKEHYNDVILLLKRVITQIEKERDEFK